MMRIANLKQKRIWEIYAGGWMTIRTNLSRSIAYKTPLTSIKKLDKGQGTRRSMIIDE